MELGELDDWSTEQLGILKEKAIMSFGAVYSWTPAEMSLTGSVIGMPINKPDIRPLKMMWHLQACSIIHIFLRKFHIP